MLNCSSKVTLLVSRVARFKPSHLASSLFSDLHWEAAMLTRGPAPEALGHGTGPLTWLALGCSPGSLLTSAFWGQESSQALGCGIWVRRHGLRRKLSQVIPKLSQHAANRATFCPSLVQRKYYNFPLEVVDFGTSVQFTSHRV